MGNCKECGSKVFDTVNGKKITYEEFIRPEVRYLRGLSEDKQKSIEMYKKVIEQGDPSMQELVERLEERDPLDSFETVVEFLMQPKVRNKLRELGYDVIKPPTHFASIKISTYDGKTSVAEGVYLTLPEDMPVAFILSDMKYYIRGLEQELEKLENINEDTAKQGIVNV